MTKNSAVDLFLSITAILIIAILFSLPFLKLIFFSAWLVTASFLLISKRKANLDLALWLFLQPLLYFSFFLITVLIFYLVFGLDKTTIIAPIIIISAIIAWRLNKLTASKPVFSLPIFEKWLIIALGTDILIIAIAIYARSAEAIFSPWNITGFSPFILFFISTFLILYSLEKTNKEGWLLLSIIHTFVFLSLSSIVYKIGFGFDPFIHRAAEEALINTGRIEPLTPLI